MSSEKDTLAYELMDKTLWWRYSTFNNENTLFLSSELEALFTDSITQLSDMTGCYTTPIMLIKIQEILNEPSHDVRFIASYNTRNGKRSFQHQLHVYVEDGQKHVLANCMDVTEMVALEREIVDAQGRLSLTQVVEREAILEEQNRFTEESYQKQSRFLAMLSHELRSPLLGISSLVERLRSTQTDEDVLMALKAIHITAEQSTFLVNDILTYSQTEYDEITLHPMAFSLKETLHNVKQLTRSIAADKGLIVSLIYLGERDIVVGDSVRLSQVLINLIVNSIKFTQYGGVTIEVVQKENRLFKFKVTDSGEGIAEDHLERIFEPFAQLESLGSTQNIGSGLGLLVVRKLVSLMGGEIAVKSTLGVGTSFYFELNFDNEVKNKLEINHADIAMEPLESTTLEESAARNSVEQVSTTDSAALFNRGGDSTRSSIKILIADDSQINLMVLGGYLEELDCTVVEAKNGREAWERFLENTFDYVFLDIQMPLMDGMQVCRKIQECVASGCGSAKNLKKVFAVTAGGDESSFSYDGEPVSANGFDHWFVKPVSKSQIITILQDDMDTPLLEEQSEDNHAIKPAEINDASADNYEKDTAWEGIEEVPEQFHSLIDSFLQELKAGFLELEALNKACDGLALAAKAHYLKGNCMLFQLHHMVALLREIEDVVQKHTQIEENKQLELTFILEKLNFGLKYLEKSITIRHNAL